MPEEQTAFPMLHLRFGLGQESECESASLYLPANDRQIKKALDSIDSCCPEECVCHSLAGRTGPMTIPDMGQFDRLNLLAFKAAELEKQGQFPKLQAMLEATGCADVEAALELAGQVDEYYLEPNTRSFTDVAQEELDVILCDRDAEFIVSSLDMEDYGQRLMTRDNMRFTDGGMLVRADHGSIPNLGPPEQGPESTEYQQMM